METKIYTDKEKIMQYLDFKGISKNKFYKKTGLSNGFLDSGSSFSIDNLRLILDKYRDLNLEWLLSGEGEMLKSDTESAYSPSSTQRKASKSDTKKHIASEPQSSFDRTFDRNLTETPPQSGKNVMSDSCDLCTEKERMIRTLEDMIVQLKDQLGDKDVIIDQYRERCTTLEADIARYTDVSDKETRQAG